MILTHVVICHFVNQSVMSWLFQPTRQAEDGLVPYHQANMPLIGAMAQQVHLLLFLHAPSFSHLCCLTIYQNKKLLNIIYSLIILTFCQHLYRICFLPKISCYETKFLHCFILYYILSKIKSIIIFSEKIIQNNIRLHNMCYILT